MANSNHTKTIAFPEWLKEISPQPEKYLEGLFRTIAFWKMKQYAKQMQPYEEKDGFSFERFEKKVKS